MLDNHVRSFAVLVNPHQQTLGVASIVLGHYHAYIVRHILEIRFTTLLLDLLVNGFVQAVDTFAVRHGQHTQIIKRRIIVRWDVPLTLDLFLLDERQVPFVVDSVTLDSLDEPLQVSDVPNLPFLISDPRAFIISSVDSKFAGRGECYLGFDGFGCAFSKFIICLPDDERVIIAQLHIVGEFAILVVDSQNFGRRVIARFDSIKQHRVSSCQRLGALDIVFPIDFIDILACHHGKQFEHLFFG